MVLTFVGSEQKNMSKTNDVGKDTADAEKEQLNIEVRRIIFICI